VYPTQPFTILARTLFKELRNASYSPNDIVRFVNELLDLVAHDLKAQRDRSPVVGDEPK
jgi:hypothetical protein